MYILNTETIDNAYSQILSLLMERGNRVLRRQKQMVELSHIFLQLTNPRARIVQNPARKLSLPFLVGEFLWILAGSDEVSFINFYNKRMASFSDDDFTLYGAYGKRLNDQWMPTIDKLTSDKYTRQAVMTILSAADAQRITKDFPCNTTLFFSVDSNDKLNLTVTVRSQDMLLGFPYDVFHWTLFMENVAKQCSLNLGMYTHLMMNCHYYQSDQDKINKILNVGQFTSSSMSPIQNSCFDDDLKQFLLFKEVTIRSGKLRHGTSSLQNIPVWSDFLKIVYNRATGHQIQLNDEALNNLYVTR